MHAYIDVTTVSPSRAPIRCSSAVESTHTHTNTYIHSALANLRLGIGVPFPTRTGRLLPPSTSEPQAAGGDGDDHKMEQGLFPPPTAIDLTNDSAAAAPRPCLLQGISHVFAASPAGKR